MPDDMQEQTTATQTEQTADVASEQTQVAVAGGNEGAVATGDGAVPEPVVSFSSEEDLRKFLEGNDLARGFLEKTKKDGFEAGRQNREAELRRQAATDEVIADRLKNVALQLGIDPDDELLKRTVTAFHEPADRRRAVSQRLLDIEAAKQTLTPEQQALVDMRVKDAGDDVDQLNKITGDLWLFTQTAAQAAGVQGLTSWEQLPEGHPLLKDFETRVAAEVEKELAARNREANAIDPGPRTSGVAGSTAPLTAESIRTMSRDELMRFPKEEREKVLKGMGA